MKRALVLSLAVVMGLGIAAFAQGELHGEWDTSITIDPTATTIATFLDFVTELTVTYSVGGWDFTSYTKLDDTGWADQYFEAGGSFGAFNIGSKLDMDTDGTFDHWSVDTSFVFGSVAIGVDFDLEPSDVRLVLTGEASTGLVDITIALTFGDLTYDGTAWVNSGDGECDLDWAGVSVTIEFPFCGCAEVTATIDIGCAGFEEACFAVEGINLPNLPWVDLDVELCFQSSSKTLTISPDFDFGADVCFDVYVCNYQTGGELPNSALELGSFYIEGIGLECEIGGVSFTGISYWGAVCDLKPDALGTYWEMYAISTTGTGDCCGPFTFDLAVFFEKGGAALFDVAAFEASFSYQFGDNFTFNMGFDYEVGAPGLTEWTMGFTVTW